MPWVLGVAHAPGYPLLTLLGRLAMLLPLGDPAYRVNLLDAAAAAATGLVYLAVVELTRRAAPAAAAWRRPGRSAGARARRDLLAAVAGRRPRPFIFFFTALLFWLLFRWGNRRIDARTAHARLRGRPGADPSSESDHALSRPGALPPRQRASACCVRLRLLLTALLAFSPTATALPLPAAS